MESQIGEISGDIADAAMPPSAITEQDPFLWPILLLLCGLDHPKELAPARARYKYSALQHGAGARTIAEKSPMITVKLEVKIDLAKLIPMLVLLKSIFG
ncbi:MAG: hypothetical protein P8Y71_13990 [Pseudolabrys sp.]